MPQNYFTRFGDDFQAKNYNILIFTQIFFVHIPRFPNLELIQVKLKDEEPNQ
jgi:hypothetical protein